MASVIAYDTNIKKTYAPLPNHEQSANANTLRGKQIRVNRFSPAFIYIEKYYTQRSICSVLRLL